MSLQSVDLALVQAYLENVRIALENDQPLHAEFLLHHALTLMSQAVASQAAVASDLPPQLAVGVGLNAGRKRKLQPNEDATFVLQGVRPLAGSQEPFGIFVVADGMGGHLNGQEASHLAVETFVDTIFSHIKEKQLSRAELRFLLTQDVQEANRVIFPRNQEEILRGGTMGTTITAAVIVGPEAHIVNVGDSRTYLYRPGRGLSQLTTDHSVVAALINKGDIHPDDIYTHPQRNMVTRCLGTNPEVEVDVFYEQLNDGDVLLLCSDGLWTMTRDTAIADILSSWFSADSMAEKLVQLALHSGGLDNISVIVVQVRMAVEGMCRN